MAVNDGPSFLPRNRKELMLWLLLVLCGAFLGRFFVVLAYHVSHQQ